MRAMVFLLVWCISLGAHAQFDESFSDGDFTANPAWTGNTSAWVVIANSDAAAGAIGSATLRLNATSRTGIEYLSTQVRGSWGQQQSWSFWLGRRSQPATASNVMFVWLYANESDVTGSTVDGYRIRYGDDLPSGDRVVLESVNDGSASPFINSNGYIPNGISDYGFLVRVTRSPAGLWTLYTSVLPTESGTGAIATDDASAANTRVFQGTAANTMITSFDNGFLALAAAHTTSPIARTSPEFDQLHFSTTGEASLPVRWNECRLGETTGGIRITWSNLTESDLACYRIERSADGLHFSILSTLQPLDNNYGAATYTYLDEHPPAPVAFYRMAALDNRGYAVYSPILRAATAHAPPAATGENALGIYPNPVRDGQLQLTAGRWAKGTYRIRIYTVKGEEVYTRRIEHGGGAFTTSLHLPLLAAGTYYLTVNTPIPIHRNFIVQ